MATVHDLKEVGESMGLEGDSLQTFIKEQQAEERDRRSLEREEREKERIFELEK
jgi:hypothetical protein